MYYFCVKKFLTLRDSEDADKEDGLFSSLLVVVDCTVFLLFISAIEVRLVRIISMIIFLHSQHTFIWGPFSKFLFGNGLAKFGEELNVWDLCRDFFGDLFSISRKSFFCVSGEWGTDPVLKR